MPKQRERMHDPRIDLPLSDYTVKPWKADSCSAGPHCPIWFSAKYSRVDPPFRTWMGHLLAFDVIVKPDDGSWTMVYGQ